MATLTEPPAIASRPGSTRWRSAGYWLATVAVVAELGLGGIWDIARLPSVRDLVTHLGSPTPQPSHVYRAAGRCGPRHPGRRAQNSGDRARGRECRSGHRGRGRALEGAMSDDDPHAEPHHPQSGFTVV